MLTKDTFVMKAMKSYDNPSCKTLIEFEEDLAKFSNLVRLCSKEMDPIITHLTMNLVVTLMNMFEPTECIKMMFFKVKRDDWPKLKTLLVYLNRMPRTIPELCVNDMEIELCQNMIETLRKT